MDEQTNTFGFSATQLGENNVRTGGSQKRVDVTYADQARRAKEQALLWEWVAGRPAGQPQPGVAYNRPPQPVKGYLAPQQQPTTVYSQLSETQQAKTALFQQLYIDKLHRLYGGNPFNDQQKVSVSALVDKNVKTYNDSDLGQLMDAQDNASIPGYAYPELRDDGDGSEFIAAAPEETLGLDLAPKASTKRGRGQLSGGDCGCRAKRLAKVMELLAEPKTRGKKKRPQVA